MRELPRASASSFDLVAMVMLIIIPYEMVMLVVMVTTVEFLMTLMIRIINEVCTKIMR